MERILEKIKAAGVVGAGGAGFPTHVKLAAQAQVVIANGAECEPLLRSDQQLMKRYPDVIVRGLKAAMEATGAKEGVIGLKAKYKDAVKVLSHAIEKEKNIRLLLLDPVYPAGDEVVLTYEATGRVVPEGGLPLDVGAVVINVNTLLNVAYALEDKPVTHRYVTVTGAVKHPAVFLAPLGMSFIRLIEQAGGPTVEDWAVISGGPMTGNVACAFASRITKTSGGIILLPKDHRLIQKKEMPVSVSMKRTKAACCQCSQCSLLCPRGLLGHSIRPHKTMRSVNYGLEDPQDPITTAMLCCNCGLCSYYACPMELSPARINQEIKKELASAGFKNPHRRRDLVPDEEYSYRKVTQSRLVRRLGLYSFDGPAPLDETPLAPERVVISLRQHLGAPAIPTVREGEKVRFGQMIGAPPEGKLGASVHASIEGVVGKIDEKGITITRNTREER